MACDSEMRKPPRLVVFLHYSGDEARGDRKRNPIMKMVHFPQISVKISAEKFVDAGLVKKLFSIIQILIP